MGAYRTFFLLLATATPLLAQNSKPVAERLAAQNAVFDEQYESDLRNFPERATSYGDYRYNDKLGDRSLAGIVERNKTDESFLARIQAISTAGFSDQDQLSHDLLIRVLEQRIADFNLKEYEMPINQQYGIHTALADLPLAVPFDSVKHYEDYIARLHQIPRVLDQTREVLRAGIKDQLMPVKFIIEKLPGQCEGIVDNDPFLLPTKKYPASISAADQKRLTEEISNAINKDVLPAYKAFAAFLRTEYAPHGRTTLSVTSLPDGQKRYENDIYARTTTRMTPDQIHQIGLQEIDRIEAEMTTIAKKAGFSDLASFRASLKTNPKYIPTSSEQILNDFRHYIAQMEPKLPQLFGLLHKSQVTVEPIPPFQAAAATHVCRDIICSCRFSSDSRVCPSSASIPRDSMRTAKAGDSMRRSWGKRSGSIRTPYPIMGVFLRNCSERCGSWLIRESTLKVGRAIKWWTSSANLAQSMNPQFNPKPIAT
jgi:uncharacterized protein (DUF885 family)